MRDWFADEMTDLVDVASRPVAIATPERPLTAIGQDLRVNLDTEVTEAVLRASLGPLIGDLGR